MTNPAPKPKESSAQLRFSNSLLNDHDQTGRQYREKDGTLYLWTGTHWQPVPILKLERMACAWLATYAQDKCNEKVAASCAATAIQRAIPLPEASHTIIPTVNGYLHIDSDGVTLKPHDEKLGVTYCLACEYNPTASVDQFLSFIAEALPDAEVRSYLQEYAGYTLLPDCRHQLACWLIGGGGNGKSTFAQIMQALHRNPVSMQLDALDGFNLAGLIGASLVYCDETPVRIDEQRLKTLVSGDSVQIDRKYRDPLVIRPTAKWIVSGNALPAISDHSDGFWRRWVIVPFDTKPKTIQPLLGDLIIEQELSGVLNWALEGLRRLLQRGKFPPLPAALVDAQKTGKQQSNSVSAWVDDAMVSVWPHNLTSKLVVYQHYVAWCRDHGMKATADEKFWGRMEIELPGILATEKRVRGKNGQYRAVGIRIENKEAMMDECSPVTYLRARG